MKTFKLKSIILICVIFFTSQISADISGVGFAQTNKEAKKEALADLSQVIKSEVRSNFESTTSDKSQNSKSNIKISSNLPILGADFNLIDRALEVEARVGLSPAKVNALYSKKLNNLKAEINSIKKEIQKSDSSLLKLQLYTDAYSLLKEYDRYESVAVILGARLPVRPSLTKAKIKLELSKLDSKLDSLEMASTVLAKSFKSSYLDILSLGQSW